ncbi:MAG: hypothetical protein LBH22_07550 [Bacteroidales bacterium]|jgi:hypothetical protein|nr:hypothetical protein [Bacteroidales bacterium]
MNYRTLSFIALGLLIICSTLKAENCECYVQSGYYQDVYNADIELLRGNPEKAYKYLQSAEQKCKMINMGMYYEIDKYIPFLLEHDELEKALYYIDLLVSEQGYRLENFQELTYFEKLKTLNSWDDIYQSLVQAEKVFVSDTAVFLRFQEMNERDQYYRRLLGNRNLTEEQRTAMWSKQKAIDDSNYIEMMLVINKLLSSEIKLSVEHKGSTLNTAYLIINHNTRDSAKLMELTPILLADLSAGSWYPSLYARMVDSHLRRGKSMYGTYTNTRTPEQTYDFENLDERRISVGLPPVSLEEERQEWFRKQHEEWLREGNNLE